MTAVIYARYSSDNQREESIEGQIRECTAYAEKNGITIVKHYIGRCKQVLGCGIEHDGCNGRDAVPTEYCGSNRCDQP